MKFTANFVSSTSACFELDNQLIYHNDQPFHVVVNGKKQPEQTTTNVFSLFGLTPDTEYTVSTTLGKFELRIRTLAESVCINIREFGAVGDGVTLDTRAIQSAINVCPPNGRVLVEGGTFYTGPILLKSNITLEIAKDAKLLASTDTKDYPVIPGEIDTVGGDKLQCSTWEGLPERCYQSFVSAFYADNVKIVGEGAIDGNGPEGVWYINHKAYVIGRPRLIFLNHCTNVSLHGLTVGDSASWTIHPFFSQNLGFYHLKVYADKYSPNTDGCNPESCTNVKIIGVEFSVGDDCIAIKSGKMYMGEKYQTPSSKLLIRNCLMQFGHGGVVLGSEMSGGVADLTVSRCIFRNTDRGLRIKTRRGRGKYAVIDNVTFSNIIMDNVLAPLVVNMYYFCDPDGKTEYVWSKDALPVDDRTPYLGSFYFKDIVCTDVEQAAGFFYGLPEQPIKSIELSNVTFKIKPDAKPGMPAMMSFAKECCKEGLVFYNVGSVTLNNVTFEGVEGENVVAEGVGQVKNV